MKIIEAMKAKTAEDLDHYVENPSWVAEEKFDGTRYLTYIRGDEIRIISRRGVDKTDRLPQLNAQFTGLARSDPLVARGAIFDGEVIADGGFLQTMSLVGSLGSRGIHKQVGYRYMVFDIIMYAGKWIGHNPLILRRQLLKKIIQPQEDGRGLGLPNICLTEQRQMSYDWLDEIWARGGEGLMLKNVHAPYEPGKRSKYWLKVKAVETADGVILGYNPGEGKYSDTVGSIQIGQFFLDPELGHLDTTIKHVTNISGMTDELRYSLGQEHIGQVVEFAYQLRTRDSYRHPRFKRFRPDKAPEECIWNETLVSEAEPPVPEALDGRTS